MFINQQMDMETYKHTIPDTKIAFPKFNAFSRASRASYMIFSKYSEDDIIKMLDVLIDNKSVAFAGKFSNR